MDLNLLLDMAVSGYRDRVAVVAGDRRLTYEDLARAAAGGAQLLRSASASAMTYVGPNHVAFPVTLFAASAAGVPYIPLNYRLGREQLEPLVVQHPDAVVVAEDLPVAGARTDRSYRREPFLDGLPADAEAEPSPAGPDDVAVLLYTSGTSGTPKAAVLRHRHLTAYVFGTVEFAGAGEDEAALVTVPPYHIAGMANLLSNLYAGRRIVYL
ncbi:MAG TPA: class I adenylate-forming enzyme family protein, partial [Acidimicrobiales bacterium]|nr:class I adenylate-forming enzyme family protein [Acidimicrobiales bacterium]